MIRFYWWVGSALSTCIEQIGLFFPLVIFPHHWISEHLFKAQIT